MDLINASAPVEFLLNDWRAWVYAAEKQVDGNVAVLLSMEAGTLPSNEKEKQARESWMVAQRILRILYERGEDLNLIAK